MEYYYIKERLDKINVLLKEVRSGRMSWQDFDIENKRLQQKLNHLRRKLEMNNMLPSVEKLINKEPMYACENVKRARRREARRIELEKQKAKDQRKKIQEKMKKETEEFLSFYKKHPISDEMIKKLKEEDPSYRKRINVVYILDKQLNIIDLVTSKDRVGYWVHDNGFSKKKLGRTTVFEYIRNETLYKDELYFVTAKNYDNFIESRKLIESILI